MHSFSIMFFTFAIIFGLYGIIENPIWILPVEILNGSLFGLTFAAALSYAIQVTPIGSEGTLVGIMGMVLDGVGAWSHSPGEMWQHIIQLWIHILIQRILKIWRYLHVFCVSGVPIGSLVGGYMFKRIGSIDSFKILSLIAFITCVVQVVVNNYCINRYSKNRRMNITPCKRIEINDGREKTSNF